MGYCQKIQQCKWMEVKNVINISPFVSCTSSVTGTKTPLYLSVWWGSNKQKQLKHLSTLSITKIEMEHDEDKSDHDDDIDNDHDVQSKHDKKEKWKKQHLSKHMKMLLLKTEQLILLSLHEWSWSLHSVPMILMIRPFGRVIIFYAAKSILGCLACAINCYEPLTKTVWWMCTAVHFGLEIFPKMQMSMKTAYWDL